MVETSNFIPDDAQLPKKRVEKSGLEEYKKPMFSKPKPELSPTERLAVAKQGGRLARLDRDLVAIGDETNKKLGADKPHTRAAEKRRETLLADEAAFREQREKEMLEKKAVAAGEVIRGAISDRKAKEKREQEAIEAQIEIAHRGRVAEKIMAAKARRAAEDAKMAYASYEVIQPPEDKEIELTEKDMLEVENPPASSKLITSEQVKAASGEIDTKHKLEKNEATNEDKLKLDRILEAYEEANSASIFTDWMLEHSEIPLTKKSVESASAIKRYLKDNFKEQESGLGYKDLLDALPVAQNYADKKRGNRTEKTAQRQTTKVIPEKRKEIKFEPVPSSDYLKPPKEQMVKEGGPVSAVLEAARAREKNMPAEARTAAENAPLVQELKNKPTKKGIDYVLQERAVGIQNKLDEITAKYLKKYLTHDVAHDFLMGEPVKGWFKGGQRKDQEKYKDLYNNKVYQIWKKAEGKNNLI